MRKPRNRWLTASLVGVPTVALTAEASLVLAYGHPRNADEGLAFLCVVSVLLAASAIIVGLAVCLSHSSGPSPLLEARPRELRPVLPGIDDVYFPEPPVVLAYPRRFSGPAATRWKTPVV